MGKYLFAMSLEIVVRVYFFSLIGKTIKSQIKDGGSNPFFSTLFLKGY